MTQSRQATIGEELELRHQKSAELYQQALDVFPSGVTHDSRFMRPFPIYVTHPKATLMALRVARAFTGKEVVVKMRGHFHGWHDYATVGMSEPWDAPSSNGVPLGVRQSMRAIPSNDIAALEEALAPATRPVAPRNTSASRRT